VLVHQGRGARTWAVLLLVPFGLWSLYQAASNPFVMDQMYPGTVRAFDWITAGIGAAVWLYIVSALAWGYVYRERYGPSWHRGTHTIRNR
jgi:hypothetical protein